MQDLHHTPTADEDVYYAIRRDIIFGRLPAGERLRLTPLAERYGSSVSALRERLVRLVSEGFATGEGQRGERVGQSRLTHGQDRIVSGVCGEFPDGHRLQTRTESTAEGPHGDPLRRRRRSPAL